jgi:hypothetical protein
MEETRPPPVVVSWAATREAAAMMAICENFMLKDVVMELTSKGLLIGSLRVEWMEVMVEKETYQQERLYIPQWGSRLATAVYAFV